MNNHHNYSYHNDTSHHSYISILLYLTLFFFFFNDPPTPEISPLPLHDPLPIPSLPATATPEIDVATPATPAGLLAAAFTPGRLDGVPALPKAYVKREDLAWLKAALLEG